jgi:hypothetical protein
LLHQGEQAPLSDIAFIARNEPLVSRANVDIERWTSSALSEQPIPVTRSPAGEWQLHAPLFDGPLEPLVGVAFPTMTSSSRKFAVIRLIELADASRSVTASHLLNVRATLDHWLTPNPVKLGQTDDWLLMLRPIPRRGAHINIGFEGKAPGFTRVDFIPSAAWMRGSEPAVGRSRNNAALRNEPPSGRCWSSRASSFTNGTSGVARY